MSPQQFRDRRCRLGLTQVRLAELLGYTARGIAKWEAGDAPITPAIDFATRYLLDHPEFIATGLGTGGKQKEVRRSLR